MTNSCYYFKIASYRENYNKNKDGNYVGLDFAYLYELSKIDKELRYEIMNLCLDIEHALKVKLVNFIVSKTDGYEPIKKFLFDKNVQKNPDNVQLEITNLELSKLLNHKNTSYTKDLVEKYKPDFPIWVFMEIISFGTLIHFLGFCKKNYDIDIVDNRLLNNVRDLRNAAAHNNCLIRRLKKDGTRPLSVITTFLKTCVSEIKPEHRKRRLSNKFTYDFICLLYLHRILVGDIEKLTRLQTLVNSRIPTHKEYFIKNSMLLSCYDFLKKVVDSLC